MRWIMTSLLATIALSTHALAAREPVQPLVSVDENLWVTFYDLPSRRFRDVRAAFVRRDFKAVSGNPPTPVIRLEDAEWARLVVDRCVTTMLVDAERHIADNQLPVLLFLAGQDRIIDNAGVLELLQQGETPGLDVLNYEDQTHSIQLDAVQRLTDDMTEWMRNLSAPR